MPIKPNPPPPPPPPSDEGDATPWLDRLAWGIPVVAILLACLGVVAILRPPFPSPGQGVRRIAPEPPPSAAPTPAPVPGPTTRPCGSPGAAPEDYRSSLVAACEEAHGELVSWAGEDGFSEPQCWRVGESEPVPLRWRAGP
jgi:hypothetical protein